MPQAMPMSSTQNTEYKKMPKLVSVTIPLYNEEESVTPLIERLDATLTGHLKNFEVILVDDGSSDATVRTAQLAMANTQMNVQLLSLQRNFGQTAAMQAGIDHAKGDIIVTLDGDLQNDPVDIPRMIDALYERDLDLLVGWREKRKDALIIRKIPSKCANWLIGRITKVKLHDYGCSLKIYRANVIKQVRLLGEMHRFIPAWVAVVIPSSRIGEMPVTHHARQFGESKYGISRTIRVLIDLLSVLFFMRYRARPGHFFGTIGLVLGFIGGIMLTYLAFDKFLLGHDIGTRPMLIVGVMMIISSIQLLCTGIVAEMITRGQHANAAQKQSYIVGDVFANTVTSQTEYVSNHHTSQPVMQNTHAVEREASLSANATATSATLQAQPMTLHSSEQMHDVKDTAALIVNDMGQVQAKGGVANNQAPWQNNMVLETPNKAEQAKPTQKETKSKRSRHHKNKRNRHGGSKRQSSQGEQQQKNHSNKKNHTNKSKASQAKSSQSHSRRSTSKFVEDVYENVQPKPKSTQQVMRTTPDNDDSFMA